MGTHRDFKRALTEREKPLLVLIPGFDGTGRLYIPLVRALSDKADTQVFSYPAETLLGYGELSHEISRELPDEPFVLVAESFGGPIALHMASKGHSNLRGIVLSTSFIENPRPVLALLFRRFIGPRVFRIRPPRWFLRKFVVGKEAGRTLIEATLSAVRAVSPEVLAFRLKEIVRVDAGQHLKACPVPILYLRAINDRLVSARSAEIMKQVRPELEVREIPGPHLLLQAAPGACAGEILEFARRVG